MNTSVNSLHEILNKKYDVFIAAASFEERSFTITESIFSKIDFDYKYVVAVLHNRDFIEDTLNKFLTDYGFLKIDVDSKNQIKTVRNYLEALFTVTKHNPDASFLIDVSTFTRQNLLILLRLLRNTLSVSKNKIDLVYSIAAEYAVGLTEEHKWLSKGVLNVNSVFGYAGNMLPSKPYHLIIMMGYEVERASSLIYEYEPAKISIGIAKRNNENDQHYELNEKKFLEIMDEFPTANKFEFSCFEVLSCKREILEQVNKYKNYNVVISPMNNKISTLALSLASFENNNIQIAIALPVIYNYDGYSRPGGNCIYLNGSELLLK